MHMKYDYYMNTGVFKPGYNIQLGESDEYIRHLRVGNDRTDGRTFIPFMEGYQKRYDELPGIIVADAGYGSYDNYMWCLTHQTDAYIKYQLYEKEKTAEFRRQKFRKENLLHEEQGKLLCPKGREFVYQSERISNSTDHLSGFAVRVLQYCEEKGINFVYGKGKRKTSILHRRGSKNVENEIYLVCIGFNLMKYHHKKLRKLLS